MKRYFHATLFVMAYLLSFALPLQAVSPDDSLMDNWGGQIANGSLRGRKIEVNIWKSTSGEPVGVVLFPGTDCVGYLKQEKIENSDHIFALEIIKGDNCVNAHTIKLTQTGNILSIQWPGKNNWDFGYAMMVHSTISAAMGQQLDKYRPELKQEKRKEEALAKAEAERQANRKAERQADIHKLLTDESFQNKFPESDLAGAWQGEFLDGAGNRYKAEIALWPGKAWDTRRVVGYVRLTDPSCVVEIFINTMPNSMDFGLNPVKLTSNAANCVGPAEKNAILTGDGQLALGNSKNRLNVYYTLRTNFDGTRTARCVENLDRQGCFALGVFRRQKVSDDMLAIFRTEKSDVITRPDQAMLDMLSSGTPASMTAQNELAAGTQQNIPRSAGVVARQESTPPAKVAAKPVSAPPAQQVSIQTEKGKKPLNIGDEERRKTHNPQFMTGNWKGKIGGRAIEIAVWPSGFTGYSEGMLWGYIYVPEQECFGQVSITATGKFSIEALQYIGDNPPNCPSPGYLRPVKGLGTYTIDVPRQRIDITMDLMAFLEKHPVPYAITLTRGTLSPEMDEFLTHFRQKSSKPNKSVMAMLRGSNAPASRSSSVVSARAKNGLIIRPPGYWIRYKNIEFKKIFEGYFPHSDSSLVFMEIYNYYQGWFAAYCPELVPKNSPGLVYITELLRGSHVEGRYETGRVGVRRKYWDKLTEFEQRRKDSYSNSAGDWIQGLPTAGSVGNILAMPANLGNRIASIKDDLDIMFTESGCQSGFQRQFDDNLYRIAHGLPVLQKETGKKFNYADTDSSKIAANEKTVEGACATYYADNRADMNDLAIHEWCNCVGKSLKPVLSGADKVKLQDDFSFINQILNPNFPLNDPRWKYSKAIRHCRE